MDSCFLSNKNNYESEFKISETTKSTLCINPSKSFYGSTYYKIIRNNQLVLENEVYGYIGGIFGISVKENDIIKIKIVNLEVPRNHTVCDEKEYEVQRPNKTNSNFASIWFEKTIKLHSL